MPPCYPIANIPGVHLFRLFRPEFVATNPKPLSSDAFSHFGSIEKAKLNGDVKEATERLMSVIDEFAKKAESWIGEAELIKIAFHERGINLRFMGAVFEQLKSDEHKRLLLIEMAARACKVKRWESLFRLCFFVSIIFFLFGKERAV